MLATYIPPFLRPSASDRKRILRRCLAVAVLPVASLAIALPASAATTAAPDAVSAAISTGTLTPAAPSGTNGWYRGPVTLNLSATDTVTGVQRIEYRLGTAAPFQTAASVNAPFPSTLTGSVPVSPEGTTSIGYRAVSGDGSIEATHTLTVRIDTVAPVVTWPGIVDGHVGHTATLIPTRTDPAPGSGGIFIQRMWIDAAEVTPLPVATSGLAPGAHTLSVVANDSAGNAARYDQTFVVTTSFTDLDTLIAGFVSSGDATADLATRLRATLAEAKGAADSGRTTQAVALLNEFRSEAQDGLAPGPVRDTLVGDARYLIDQLRGTLPAEPPTGVTVTRVPGPNPIPAAAPSSGSTNFPGATFRVLYFSATKGFRHDHIPDTAALVEQWGQQYIDRYEKFAASWLFQRHSALQLKL